VLVLPGVGAFGAAASGSLRAATRCELHSAPASRASASVSACSSCSIASDESTPDVPGLGLIGGRVTRLQACRVPQIGWNSLDRTSDPLLEVAPLPYAYYANSYVCRPNDDAVVRGWSTHEER
jgi:glutamine amidotransferase